MTEQRPDIVIGPLTLVWQQEEGKAGFYTGTYVRALFMINRIHIGWIWFCDAGGIWQRWPALTLEDAVAAITRFLTALGVIHE